MKLKLLCFVISGHELFSASLFFSCVRSGTPIDAKESDMSDTLSPSKDRSSDDTSG